MKDEEVGETDETLAVVEPQETQVTVPAHKDLTPPPVEEEPLGELLQNEMQEKVEEKKKKTTGKASFWDKLK